MMAGLIPTHICPPETAVVCVPEVGGIYFDRRGIGHTAALPAAQNQTNA